MYSFSHRPLSTSYLPPRTYSKGKHKGRLIYSIVRYMWVKHTMLLFCGAVSHDTQNLPITYQHGYRQYFPPTKSDKKDTSGGGRTHDIRIAYKPYLIPMKGVKYKSGALPLRHRSYALTFFSLMQYIETYSNLLQQGYCAVQIFLVHPNISYVAVNYLGRRV